MDDMINRHDSIAEENIEPNGRPAKNEFEEWSTEVTDRADNVFKGDTKEKEVLEVWGNFEPTGIQKLKDAGYIIGFYSCSEGNYKEEWETEYNAMIVNRISSKVFFVTVTKAGQEVDLDVEQAKLPAYSLSRLEALYDTTEQAIEGNEKKLVALSETDIPSLKAALKELQSQIEFSKVVLSSEQTAGCDGADTGKRKKYRNND